MAETLRELVVALSLDSSNFSRNMRTINQQIKEAESTFRLAGAGVQNYEKANAETKHMIIARLVERIEINHDYEVEIKFRISVEQYMRIAA